MTFDSQAIASRTALLDAAFALSEHLDSLVLVGAQAIYLYTGDADVPIATVTKDSDIGIVPDCLGGDPTLDVAMVSAGFSPDIEGHQGKWINEAGVPVDLLVPEGLQDHGDRDVPRGARIAPHSPRAARNVIGIEGIAVDFREFTLRSLEDGDEREIGINVAGPATLVVAKTHKICERFEEADHGRRDRTNSKDAHDLYRLLRAVELDELLEGFSTLLGHGRVAPSAIWAIDKIAEYGVGPESRIGQLAGEAENLVGNPAFVSEAVEVLARELLDGLDRDGVR